MDIWQVKTMKIGDLVPNAKNPRKISKEKLEALQDKIQRLGFHNPIKVDENLTVLGGNQRLKALLKIAGKDLEVPVMFPNRPLTKEEKDEIIITDNVSDGEWDWDVLTKEWSKELTESWGLNWDECDTVEEKQGNSNSAVKLQDKFIIPPLTVFDTRQGYWQDRKRAWNNLIGDKGESRQGTLGFRSLINNMYGKTGIKSVSILDAALAEIINTWFLPTGVKCKTCDPFAGDTVFGFVSSYLGNEFTGIELRKEQAELNNSRVAGLSAKYINDDGQNIAQHLETNSQDLIFSCPPYFDLEKYSDLPNDASNQDYQGFIQILDNAFTGAIKCLKENRFAVIVMSDVRDKKGYYLPICDDITRIFAKNGMSLYNEIILVNVAGTAQIRAAKAMQNRKVTRVHQEVLVFYKGDVSKIKNDFGNVEVSEIESEDE